MADRRRRSVSPPAALCSSSGVKALQDLEARERGTQRWYQALDRVNAAERDLEQYESDLDLLALMRAELADPSGDPAIVAALLAAARDRRDGRPWKSPLRG
jgi:hypothetical protein